MASAFRRVVTSVVVLSCMQEAAARAGLRLGAGRASMQHRANPIRRVVTLLQTMQKKVKEEGEKELELYDKYMCYCKTGTAELEKSIAAAEEKVEQLTSSIEEASSGKETLVGELKAAKEGRKEAVAALANAKAVREREVKAYMKASSELKTNIEALKKAIAALEKGMAGAFLQTSTASVLRSLSVTVDMNFGDREELAAFLSQGQGGTSGYAPQSGEIVGILKQMLDTMEKHLAEGISAEEASKASMASLAEAKNKEIETLTTSIEAKTAKLGEAGVDLVNMKDDLKDTSEALVDDKAFLKGLAEGCTTKTTEWEARKKTRAQEAVAIADTIKILNDDDSLELFKKTLPSPSLLQLQATSRAMKQRALAVLQRGGRRSSFRLNLISLAIRGKTKSFEKIIEMIDTMVVQLGKEQKHDESKKSYCLQEIDKLEDTIKELDNTISGLTAVIDTHEEAIPKVAEEIDALVAGIKDLDKQVAEATEQRKEEHAAFVSTLANDRATVELLGVAKNRLNKFYAPDLYKAPTRDLTEEERIYSNFGGVLETPAPSGIADTGIEVSDFEPASFVQVDASSDSNAAPPPPPETWDAYRKKGEESAGVTAMIDILVKDLEKEITELGVEEKDAQADYESLLKAAEVKRITDTKTLEAKESLKAESEEKLLTVQEDKKAKVSELMSTGESLKDLHMDCDWLLQNFDVRKEARAGEVESLKNAQAVLAGADYSLLQRVHVHHHRL